MDQPKNEARGHDQSGEEFQLERIALFSDAVFAIAITLLVIELKVPELHVQETSDEALLNALLSNLPKFIGFLVSFFVIGLYWLSHHRLFRYVVHSNRQLLWANLLFLLPVVLMPFSTAFLSEFFNGALRVPLAVYTVNICFAGFFSYRLWAIVANPRNHISKDLDPVILRYNITRALTTPFIFLFVFGCSFFNSWIAYIVLPFLPLISKLISRHYFKKYPAIMQRHLK